MEKDDMHYNIFDQASREIKSKDNVFGNFLVEKGLYDEIEITSFQKHFCSYDNMI